MYLFIPEENVFVNTRGKCICLYRGFGEFILASPRGHRGNTQHHELQYFKPNGPFALEWKLKEPATRINGNHQTYYTTEFNFERLGD